MNVLQSSPSLTKSQRLQLSIVPGCVGPGAPPELVGVGVEELETTLLEVGAGSGSLKASTQYDFPVSKLPHSALTEGFYSQSEQCFSDLERLLKRPKLTHRLKSARVMAQVAGMSVQATEPSFSNHQVQCSVVFGSYGRRGFSSLFDVEAKDELNKVGAKVARRSVLANILTKRRTRQAGLQYRRCRGPLI